MDNFTRLRKYIERSAHIHAADPDDWQFRVMAGKRIIAALPPNIVIGRIRSRATVLTFRNRRANNGQD